jgi:polyisoprenyl-phosphate glycosyltransferase
LTAPVLAIIVPCYNEVETFKYTVETLSAILDEKVEKGHISASSYILFVDDGSADGTWDLITVLSSVATRVRGLRLSRNFGHQYAVMAGIDVARKCCEISISIDADLQQDPRAISDFVSCYKNGAEVVFGVRRVRETDGFFKRFTAVGFYSLMKSMGAELIPNHADYRLLSKRAMETLMLFEEPHLFLRGLCPMLGFKSDVVQFNVVERRYGATKYSVKKMLKLAVYGITSLSVVPLRMVAVIGLLCFLGSILMAAYVLWHSVLVGDTIPGWASTTLPIYFLAGIQLLSIGVIGEYVGKIFSAVQRRPRWIVRDSVGLEAAE